MFVNRSADVINRRWGLLGFTVFFFGSLIAIQWLFASRSPNLYGLLVGLGMLQFAAGLWLVSYCCRGQLRLLSIQGWPWALAALTGLMVLQEAMASPTLGPIRGWSMAIIDLLRLIVCIGLVEELWFRGVWMTLFKDRPWIAVGVGSLLFGLFHAAHGVQTMILTAGVGLTFAAARYRGASVFTLGLAHGLMDWFNQVMFPGSQFRFDPTLVAWVFPISCILLTLLLLLMPTRNASTAKPAPPQ